MTTVASVRAFAAGVATVALVGATACGAGNSADERPATTAGGLQVRDFVDLVVTRPDPAEVTVKRPTMVIEGTVDPEAVLTVDGEPVDVAPDGTWTHEVRLRVGAQAVEAEASRDGYRSSSREIDVTRKRSAAELAELRRKREEARQRRELERQQAEESFKASAVSIPYNQLEKNAERYRGERVVYHGQIFQIQESTYGGGIMLLAVTDEGYGYWTDNIWVDYDGHVEGAEDDFVTVYGTIRGSKSYETQIGGETYVPRVRARYIDE